MLLQFLDPGLTALGESRYASSLPQSLFLSLNSRQATWISSACAHYQLILTIPACLHSPTYSRMALWLCCPCQPPDPKNCSLGNVSKVCPLIQTHAPAFESWSWTPQVWTIPSLLTSLSVFSLFFSLFCWIIFPNTLLWSYFLAYKASLTLPCKLYAFLTVQSLHELTPIFFTTLFFMFTHIPAIII